MTPAAGRTRPLSSNGCIMLSPGISVIIPTWNGRKLLEACLPGVRAALAACGRAWEIIVADDASSDDTLNFLSREWPEVRVAHLGARCGFVGAANAGLDLAGHEFTCMLNNDMTVEPEFFSALAQTMEADPRAFAVSARAFEAGTAKLNIGRRRRWIENNEIKGAGQETDAPGVCATFFASGGASLFRTCDMRALGGFDTLYAPFYIEDADLSYRAWKRGRVVLYDPRAVAHHIGGASITRKGASLLVRVPNKLRVSAIIHRNAILFYIKNITDPDLWAAYKKRFATWGLLNLVRFRWTYFMGMAWAVPRLPRALRARRVEIAEASITDRTLFDLLNADDYEPDQN